MSPVLISFSEKAPLTNEIFLQKIPDSPLCSNNEKLEDDFRHDLC